MRKSDHIPDIQRLRRLITEALEIADRHDLLDVGICLDGALVRLSEIDRHGLEPDIHPPLEEADWTDN